MGWDNLKDHILLPKVAAEFDVLLTADQGFEFEHNLRKLTIGIIIVHVTRNKLEDYRVIASKLFAAVAAVRAGQIVHVPSPEL